MIYMCVCTYTNIYYANYRASNEVLGHNQHVSCQKSSNQHICSLYTLICTKCHCIWPSLFSASPLTQTGWTVGHSSHEHDTCLSLIWKEYILVNTYYLLILTVF